MHYLISYVCFRLEVIIKNPFTNVCWERISLYVHSNECMYTYIHAYIRVRYYKNILMSTYNRLFISYKKITYIFQYLPTDRL